MSPGLRSVGDAVLGSRVSAEPVTVQLLPEPHSGRPREAGGDHGPQLPPQPCIKELGSGGERCLWQTPLHLEERLQQAWP